MSVGSSRSNYSTSVMKTTLRQTLSQYSSLSAKTSTQSRSSTPPDLIRNITNATVRQVSSSAHCPPSVEDAEMCPQEPQPVATTKTTSPTTMMMMLLTTTTTTMLTSDQRLEHHRSHRKKATTKSKKQKNDHNHRHHRHHHHRDRPDNPIVLQLMEEYCGDDS